MFFKSLKGLLCLKLRIAVFNSIAVTLDHLFDRIIEGTRHRAEQEKQRAERLAAQLRTLGVDIDDSL